MAVAIEVDVAAARSEVAQLNADIMAIAASAASVKSAFSGSDFLSGIVGGAATAKTAIESLETTARQLNTTLGQTSAGLSGYVNSSRAVVDVAQSASKAILSKAQSLQQSATAAKQAASATQILTAAEATATLTWTNQEKVIRSTITAAQLKKQVMKELADLELSGQITTQQSLRYQEQMVATYQKTGTAAEVMLASLKSQNALFNASTEALAASTAGWRIMTEGQQKALVTQLEISKALQQTDSILNASASIMGEYNKNLLALTTLKQQGVISEGQYKNAIVALDSALEGQISQVKASAKAMQDKSYADSQAAVQEKKVAEAIAATSGIVQRGIDPVVQYKNSLQALNTALAGAQTQSGGRIGLSVQQYTQGLAGARAELEKNIATSLRATSVTSSLSSQFGFGTQAAAGFRAGIQGAGLGFGIFTGQTIVAATAVFSITKAIKESLAAGVDFQERFSRASAVLGIYAGASKDAASTSTLLKAEIMGLAESSQFTSSQITDAVKALGQAGRDAAGAMRDLPAVLNLATVGEISTEEAANKLVNTIQSFQLGVGSAADVADKLTRASLVSTTTIGELAVGLGQVGQSAHGAGVGLEDTLAVLSTLRQVGIQASKAGTDFRMILQRLAQPTTQAKQALHELGLEAKDFWSKDGLELNKTLELLRNGLQRLDAQARSSVMTSIFGSRSSGAALALTTQIDLLKQYQTEIQKSSGDAQKLADVINNNTGTAFKQLKATLTDVAITAFDSYSANLTEGLRNFAEFVRANGPQISATLASIAAGILSITTFLISNAGTITTAIVAYEAFRVTVALGATAQALFSKAQLAYVAAAKLAEAAAVEDAIAVNTQAAAAERAAVANTGLAGAMGAETVAAEGAAAANGAAALAMEGAAVRGAGAMGMLRGAGAGVLAMIGGWPTVIVGAIAGIGYLAVKAYETFTPVQVDVKGVTDQFNLLRQASNNLGSLGGAGLGKFREVVEGEAIRLRQAISDLEHNKKILEEASTDVAGDAGFVVVHPEQLAAIDKTNGELDLMHTRLEAIGDINQRIQFNQLFDVPEIAQFTNDLAKAANTGDTVFANFYSRAKSATLVLSELARALSQVGPAMSTLFGGGVANLGSTGGTAITTFLNKLNNAVAMLKPGVKPDTGDDDRIPKTTAKLSALDGELKTIITDFEKSTNSATEFSKQFEEIGKLSDALAKGGMSAELKKIGASADEARAALNWKAGSITLDSLKKSLTDLNPVFAKIKDPMKDLVSTSDELGDAYKSVDTIVSQLISKYPKFAAEISKMGEQVKQELPGLLNGSTAALAQFDDNLKNIQKSVDKVFKVEGFDAFISQVQDAGRETTAASVGASAWAAAIGVLGGNEKSAAKAIGDVTDATSQSDDMMKIWIALNNDPVFQAQPERLAAIGRAFQNVYNATALGALQLSNQNIQNQIGLIEKGTMDLTEYNEVWKLTKGGVLPVTDAILQAAHAQTLLNEQFSKMQAVQQTFKGFADSLGGAFSKFFTSTSDGWKGLVSDIKSSFKQLLADLIKQAITNQILFYFGFNQSGSGGGGGSLGGIIGAVANWFGGGSGGGGGTGASAGDINSGTSGWTISDLAGLAAQNNSSSGGGGGGVGSYIQQGQSLYNIGSRAYNTFTGGSGNSLTSSLYGAGPGGGIGGGSSMFGSYYGANFTGPLPAGASYGGFAPSALGYGAAGAAGLYAGYQAYNRVGGGLRGAGAAAGYGLGTTALSLGAMSVLSGGTFAAGVGSMAGGATALGASSGVAAAIPIVGWVALAAMLVDHFTGGKIFGSGWAPKNSTSAVTLGQDGASVSNSALMWRYQSQLSQSLGNFGGLLSLSDWGKKDWKTQDIPVTPEMQAAADKFYKEIGDIMKNGATQLGVDVPPMIDATMRTVTEYDKKGKVSATNFFVDILGRTWKETTAELASTRIRAEAIIATIAASAGNVQGSLPTGTDATSTITGGNGNPTGRGQTGTAEDTGNPAATKNLTDASTAMVNEAQLVAERWRSDATLLMDGAQLMLAVQTDILHGNGLLRQAAAPGVLTATVDVIQKLATGDEKLADTYARLVTETALVETIMSTTGNAAARSGADFVQFSDDVVRSLGGIDQANALWTSFSSTVFNGVSQISQATSSGNLAPQLTALGMAATSTITDFAAAFKQVSSSLDADTLAKWIKAGAALGAIKQGMDVLQGMAHGVDLTSVMSQRQQMVASINAQIDAAAKLGASEKQLAEMRKLGQEAIDRQLSDFMGGITTQLGKFEGGAYTQQLKAIHDQMLQNIDTARQLGASEQDLADIQHLAAYQTAAVIADLQASIRSLVNQLHGVSDANNSAGSSANNAASAGQNALLQAQRDLYDAAQRAIKDITAFLDSLQTGPLSTNDWQGQLNASADQFNALVTRAQGGDVDAMAQLTQYAQTYLQHAQDAYGNGTAYDNILQTVTATLESLRNQFSHIAQPPGTPGGSDSSTSIIGTVTTTQTDSDRYMLALKIAQQVGALGLATGVDIFKILDKFGTSVGELASAMGIDITHITDATFDGLNVLARSLNLPMIDLLNALNASPAAIGGYFDVTAANINAGNLANIVTMAEALGISAFDAIKYMGGDLAAAVKANGIDITSLDSATMDALGGISTTLGVSIVELLTNLGLGIDKFAQPLADCITNDLSQIPGLSATTLAGMTPLLEALGHAITTGDLSAAITAIGTYIATLPADQQAALNGVFSGLGIKFDNTTTAVNASKDVQTTIATNTSNTTAAVNAMSEAIVTPLSSMKTNSDTSTQYLSDIRDNLLTNGTSNTQNVTVGGFGSSAYSGGLGGSGGGSTINTTNIAAQTAAATASYVSGNVTNAGQQLHEMATNSHSSQQRAAQSAEQTAQHVAQLNTKIENMTSAVVSKLEQVNESQKGTTQGVRKMTKKVSTIKINRGVRK